MSHRHFHAPFWRIANAPEPPPVQGDDPLVPSLTNTTVPFAGVPRLAKTVAVRVMNPLDCVTQVVQVKLLEPSSAKGLTAVMGNWNCVQARFPPEVQLRA